MRAARACGALRTRMNKSSCALTNSPRAYRTSGGGGGGSSRDDYYCHCCCCRCCRRCSYYRCYCHYRRPSMRPFSALPGAAIRSRGGDLFALSAEVVAAKAANAAAAERHLSGRKCALLSEQSADQSRVRMQITCARQWPVCVCGRIGPNGFVFYFSLCDSVTSVAECAMHSRHSRRRRLDAIYPPAAAYQRQDQRANKWMHARAGAHWRAIN